MENGEKGLLVEAQVVACEICGNQIYLHWGDGRNMSRSQASHLLNIEYNQHYQNGVQFCNECYKV